MTTDQIQILLYNDAEGSTIPISTYLWRRRRGRVDWEPYLGLVGFSLKVGGKERWTKPASMGNLANLIVQFEAGVSRLEVGKPALVRSGVDDSDDAPFLLFEPEGKTVLVSIFSIPDTEIGARYPTTADGLPVEEMYQYVTSRMGELLTQSDPGWRPHFTRVEMDLPDLIVNLKHEAVTGRELYVALEQQFRIEIYG